MNGNAYDQQPFHPSLPARQYFQHQSHPSIQPAITPPTQLTPYQLYMKPAQPSDLLQPQAGTAINQQNPSPNGLMGLFTDANGEMDFDKMLHSIGQIAGTYHQVSPIVKQFGSIIKMLRV